MEPIMVAIAVMYNFIRAVGFVVVIPAYGIVELISQYI